MSSSQDILLTHHAEARLQQRGVRMRLARILLENTDRVLHAGDGCETHIVSRSTLAGLVSSGEVTPDDAARAGRLVLLLGRKGIVSVIRPHKGARGRRYRRQMATRAAWGDRSHG